jgi:hypothetical protein
MAIHSRSEKLCLKSPGSEISLCNLCVLCVSVVDECRAKHTTETQRLHREVSELRQSLELVYDVPTRYREVVLTVSKQSS